MNDTANSVRPDYAASLDFLRKVHPGRRWALTAILPDKPAPGQHKTITATFDEKHEAECLKWLEEKGQTRNIYWSVAEPNKHLLKKGERTDIAKVWYLHVDIDPRAGEPIPAEQARILALLNGTGRPDVIPGKLPAPSVITFSGGGYQGFWEIDVPIDIDGKLDRAEDAKLFNLAIEIALGADSCHNIDRVMRLPGTVNRPDKMKRAKGRVEALAEVVTWSDAKYGLDRFTRAPQIKVDAGGDVVADPKSAPKVDTSNVKRLDTLDNLPVAAWVKALINIGYDPKNPNPLLEKRYPSRSEALFAVVCQLYKGRVDEQTIYSIITDERFGISASVLELGRRAERYAFRQIDRAKAECTHPWLEKMNNKYAVVDLNGKSRVIREKYDKTLKHHKIVKYTFDAFDELHSNIKVDLGFTDDGKPISKPLGSWWLGQPHRRQYDGLVFAPGLDVGDDEYNLWRGFNCEAKQGDCSLFLAHFRDVICNGNADCYEYALGWLATAVQKPWEPAGTAFVMKGGQGTGKGHLPLYFGRGLFGRHYYHVINPKHLVGNFNAHLANTVVLFADECLYAGNKQHEEILKGLITEETRVHEAKGVDADDITNCLHIFMSTNSEWAVPAGLDDRRFFILNVSDAHKQQTAYFKAIRHEMSSGGREALLHYLLSYDLSGFDIFKVPETEEKRRQKQLSSDLPEQTMLGYLTEGITPGDDIDKGIDAAAFDIDVFAREAKMKPQAASDWMLKWNLLVLDGHGEPVRPRRKLWRVPGHPERYASKNHVPAELQAQAERTANGKRLYQFRELAELRTAEPWCRLKTNWPKINHWRLDSDGEGVSWIPDQSEMFDQLTTA